MITGKKVLLRPPRREDIESWLVWMNDPEITRFLCNRAIYGYTRKQEEEFYESIQNPGRSDAVFSADTLDGLHIGSVGLHAINWEWRKAELGILIGRKDLWNKGYCREMMQLAVRFAFDRMNLHRVYLYVSCRNTGGIKCYERVGFKREGILRQSRYYDGEYSDDLVMGILKGELLTDED
jgi:RimJ/RimL family protein N-acetyltransferase